jgi:hypothetical protein
VGARVFDENGARFKCAEVVTFGIVQVACTQSMKSSPQKDQANRETEMYKPTCRPAFAECDFCDLPASAPPAFPPVLPPVLPAITSEPIPSYHTLMRPIIPLPPAITNVESGELKLRLM